MLNIVFRLRPGRLLLDARKEHAYRPWQAAVEAWIKGMKNKHSHPETVIAVRTDGGPHVFAIPDQRLVEMMDDLFDLVGTIDEEGMMIDINSIVSTLARENSEKACVGAVIVAADVGGLINISESQHVTEGEGAPS